MDKCSQCGASVKEKDKTCGSCGAILIPLSVEVASHINLLRKKIESEPSNVKLYIDLGDLYQRYDLLSEALNEYQKAMKVDANNFDAHSKSAIIYLKLKDLGKAEGSFRTALHINPKSEESLIGLFRTYYLQNKTVEAIALGEKIVKSKPDSVEFRMLLKNLYKQKGDKEKVLMELQKLESLIPNNQQVIKEIAQYYKDQNNMEGLIKYYKKMLEMNIEDIDLGFRIGKYYFDNKEHDKAIEHLNGLRKKKNITAEMDAMIYTYLALAYFNKGDIPNAKNLIAETDPSHMQNIDEETQKRLASLFFELGQNNLQGNRVKVAIYFFEKAVSLDKETAGYQQTLDKTKNDVAISNKNFLNRILFIVISAVAACIFIVLVWILIHNKIIIHVEPAVDVVILIDGKPIMTQSEKPGVIVSPTMLMGPHRVVIEKEGYEKWQGIANIGFGKKAVVKANLISVYGAFRVNSEPEGAGVYLDGEVIGTTPFISGDVLATAHKIDIEAPGHLTYSRNITITKGDTVDLGMNSLKNLAGPWLGKIGEDGYMYNASFSMTIKQNGAQITVKYHHQPSEDFTYGGEINGAVSKNEFLVEGYVNYKYLNIFYWVNTKKKMVIKGKISDDWERIDGEHYVEGLGGHNWWATRKK